VAPKAPAPVIANGKRVLVYELHVTNFGKGPLALRRIEIAGVADLSGDTLTKSLSPVGESSDPARLDVGRRVIVFLWLELPSGKPAPRELKHRLTFDLVPGDETARQSVIDDVIVPVSSAPVPVIALPLSPGEWLAGSAPSNTSVHRRSVITVEGRASIAQRFAIDFVKIGPNGDTTHDGRASNDHFWVFGTDVRAVAGGEVTEVVDAYPGNEPDKPPPPTIASLAGNHVIIRIARGQYALFAHLRQHSILVHVNDTVKRGEVIAKVGDSGNTTGPHLHFQLMDRNSALASEGIPCVFDHFSFLGFGADFEESHHPTEPRRNDLPVDSEVIGVK
jgi:hypothetical protein